MDKTDGVLVPSNHGLLKDLIIDGKNIGSKIAKELEMETQADKGSIISIVANDLPLSSRQSKRICKKHLLNFGRCFLLLNTIV
ncbi:P1 family peptidase [Schnuerera ultunensis]|uniref:P1 family peptidase n=1 Tax=Schnuerera ultunensis TaxID=45497 RepID=UPI0009E09721